MAGFEAPNDTVKSGLATTMAYRTVNCTEYPKFAISLVPRRVDVDSTGGQQTKFGFMPCGHLREVPLSAGFFYARDSVVSGFRCV